MKKRYCWVILFVAAAIVITGMSHIVLGQNPSTKIRVLDATGVEGIAGVILLVNPGDARKSEAFVTNTQGEASMHGLQCEICTISAFDPRGLFAGRTMEFSNSNTSFSFVMYTLPLIEKVGDPKAMSIELVIHDSKGEPFAQQNVVIRPRIITMENNNLLSVQRTDATGLVAAKLLAGNYIVGALNGNSASEARFEITTAKEECSERAGTCIVASPRYLSHIKPVSLQLFSTSLR
jgi:hypothetical protein